MTALAVCGEVPSRVALYSRTSLRFKVRIDKVRATFVSFIKAEKTRSLRMKKLIQMSAFALAASATMATARIATVDPQRLFTQSKAGMAVIEEIETRKQDVAQQNQKDVQELQERAQRFQKKAPLMTEDAMQIEAAALQTAESRVQLEAKDRAQAANIWAQHRQNNVMRKQMEALDTIRKEDGYEGIMDQRMMLAWGKETDITDSVVERLDALMMQDDAGKDSVKMAKASSDTLQA
jgi:Skp family chaperone for outer membrane proteins